MRVGCVNDFGRAARNSIGSSCLARHKISPGGMERWEGRAVSVGAKGGGDPEKNTDLATDVGQDR